MMNKKVSTHFSSLGMVFRNTGRLLSAGVFQVVSGVLITAFLLFFLNILGIASYQIDASADQVQQKLGMYFYLNDDPKYKDIVYSQAIELMKELKDAGMQVEFYSKEDAFVLLEKRLPNVIGSLEKFGIANPLPPTIYVMFRNQEEYEQLKTIVLKYEAIIGDLKKMTWWFTFTEQEARVATVINLMHALIGTSWWLIVLVVVILAFFLRYSINLHFLRFYKQIELEKLLGAEYRKIALPFWLYTAVLLICAMFLVILIFLLAERYFDPYFQKVYNMPIAEALLPAKGVVARAITIEFFTIFAVSTVASGWTLWNLLRKV
jgi:cell division protein FtsX